MNKVAIFDLDGTIIDSLPDIIISVNATMRKFGHKERSYDEIRKFIGNGARLLIERCLGEKFDEDKFLERLDYYNDTYTNSGSPNTKVFDGMKEVLLELKNRGYYIGVITNKPQMTVDNIMQTYFKGIEFDALIGQSEGVKIKPDPKTTFSILEKFNIENENAYFIGDGETDYQTSVNANINGISVLWGYRTKEELQGAGAKTFVEKPSELLDILK